MNDKEAKVVERAGLSVQVNSAERIVEGIAIPWDVVVNTPQDYGKNAVLRDAFGPASDLVGKPIYHGHDYVNRGTPVGHIVAATSTSVGLNISAKIATTAKGEEVWTLVNENVLRSFSATYMPTDWVERGDTVFFTKADLKEVSIVAMPVYKEALITAIRDETSSLVEDATPTETPADVKTAADPNENMETTMNDEVTAEVAALRDEVADLKRTQSVSRVEAPAGPVFRSYGEYVSAYIKGDEKVLAFAERAFNGTADTLMQAQWTSRAVELVNLGRTAFSAFQTSALPAEGNTVSTPKVTTKTIAVGKQAAQGDVLAEGGLVLGIDTWNVDTYGGHMNVTRQLAERSSAEFLGAAFEEMGIQYAKSTNTAVQAILTAGTGFNTGTALAGNTVAAWTKLIAEASVKIKRDTGRKLEFLLVSDVVWSNLVQLVDTSGRPVLDFTNSGVNTIGSGAMADVQATLFGVPVLVDLHMTGNAIYAANSAAIVTFESPGAPFRLQDGSITTLVNSFSVYGYVALTVPRPKGIVKVTSTLV